MTENPNTEPLEVQEPQEQGIPPEILAALERDGFIEDQNNTQEEQPQDGTPEEWIPPEYVVIDGERIPWEQAQAGWLRQSDYTKKTQEVSERAKKIENLELWADAWDNRPDLRPVLLQQLAQDAGVQVQIGGTSQPTALQPQTQHGDARWGAYNPGDPDPEWQQRGYSSEAELYLHRQNLMIADQLKKVEQFIGQTAAEKEREIQATKAAAEIAATYGIEGVTPELVKAAMQQTGLNDPEAAFLKANAKTLLGQAAPKTQPAATKPQAPSSTRGRVFDPNDPNLNADDIVRLMASGYTPVGQRK